MKKFKFNSEEEFLNALDGKIYAISKKDGSFLCDILEEDYIKLLDAGIIINLCEVCPDTFKGIEHFSDYVVSVELSTLGCLDFINKYGVFIEKDY